MLRKSAGPYRPSPASRENLDRVIEADQCAQYVDDIRIAANHADQFIKKLRATFECIREAVLKLAMHKCRFGATETGFLGKTITPEGVKPQKEIITNFSEVQEGLALLSWFP